MHLNNCITYQISSCHLNLIMKLYNLRNFHLNLIMKIMKMNRFRKEDSLSKPMELLCLYYLNDGGEESIPVFEGKDVAYYTCTIATLGQGTH